MQGQLVLHALCWWAVARGKKEAPGEGPNRRNTHNPPKVAAPEPHWGRNAVIRANLPFLHRRGPAKKKQGPAAAGGRGEETPPTTMTATTPWKTMIKTPTTPKNKKKSQKNHIKQSTNE